MSTAPEVLIIAGETSGDDHAARVLRAWKQEVPDLKAWGFGGDALAAEGMEVTQHVRDLAVMGFWEVLKRYGWFRRIFNELLAEIKRRKPSLILLVDYPGFNLRLAAAVKDLDIPVVQYVCPQVWAWKKSRIPKMAEVLDALICLFPFEPAVFKGVDLAVQYCGHPLVDQTKTVGADSGWQAGRPHLALVPGSREQEVDRLFLPMLLTSQLVQESMPEVQVRVSAANADREEQMKRLSAEAGFDTPELVRGGMRELVKGADAALVTSGTATLETALLGTPMLVVYKTSAATYAVGKRLIKVPFIGMVNLIAEREVCPEFIQGDAEPGAMAEAVRPLLSDSPERQSMLEGLSDVRTRLVSDDQARKVVAVLEDVRSGVSDNNPQADNGETQV